MLKKNILLGFLFQSITIICTFFIVPYSITYLGDYTYGVWVTFFGMILWIGSLDFGISNGFRNLLARSFVIDDINHTKTLVSSTIIIFTMISVFISAIGLLINFNSIDYYSEIYNSKELYIMMFFLIIIYSINLVLNTTSVIYTSKQQSAFVPLITALSSVLSLILLMILSKNDFVFFESKILTYAMCVGSMPVISNFLVTVYAYSTKLNAFFPSRKYYDFEIIKRTTRDGCKFFIIQVSMIISLQLSNLFIINWSTAENVTKINIADKYFGILMVFGSVILFPFWSKFTEADEHKNYKWIKDILKKLDYLTVSIFMLGLIMWTFFDFFKSIWLKDDIYIPKALSFLVLLKYLSIFFNSVYSYYLNGLGKLKLQMILYVLIGVLNYPISILLNNHYGYLGILVWPIFSMFTMGVILKVYSKRDLHQKLQNQL